MGIRSTHDLGLCGLIEVVLVACLRDLLKGKREGVARCCLGGEDLVRWLRQHVISPQLSKESVTGLTISCIHDCIFPFSCLNKSSIPLKQMHANLS